MSTRLLNRFAILAATCVVAAAPAVAQKAEDTLRMAIKTPLGQLSVYTLPTPDAYIATRDVYDPLVQYDEHRKEFRPGLARSWTRIDPTTVEFALRDDIKFHDGSKFDADDVAATVNWAVDPKTRMQFKNRYDALIAGAEKTGPYTVRIRTKGPSVIDLTRYNISLFMMDSDLLAKSVADDVDYGVRAVGTGPYKLVSLDAGRSFALERNEDYRLGPKPAIRRVVVRTIADYQTQIAELLSGGLDLIVDPTRDQIEGLKDNPDVAASVVGGLTWMSLHLDALDRSGEAAPLKDVRVRRAIAAAIDRAEIARTFGLGIARTRLPNAMCLEEMVGCKHTVAPQGFDPALARRLLAEAGYADGFKLEVTANPASRVVAEAIVGYLNNVGIKASNKHMVLQAIRSARGQGKLYADVVTIPGLAMPDSHLWFQVNIFVRAHDYWQDQAVNDAARKALFIRDAKLREDTYATAFDRMNEQVYTIPVLRLPDAYLHRTDVAVTQPPLVAYSPTLRSFHWAR